MTRPVWCGWDSECDYQRAAGSGLPADPCRERAWSKILTIEDYRGYGRLRRDSYRFPRFLAWGVSLLVSTAQVPCLKDTNKHITFAQSRAFFHRSSPVLVRASTTSHHHGDKVPGSKIQIRPGRTVTFAAVGRRGLDLQHLERGGGPQRGHGHLLDVALVARGRGLDAAEVDLLRAQRGLVSLVTFEYSIAALEGAAGAPLAEQQPPSWMMMCRHGGSGGRSMGGRVCVRGVVSP